MRNQLLNEVAGAVLSPREVVRNAWPTIVTTLAIAALMLADIPNI